MRHTISLVAVALLLGLPAAVSAQNGNEPVIEQVIPGWVFTPSMSVGVSHDDNPLLASHGNPAPNDVVTLVRPGGELSFTQKHTRLAMNYRGTLVRYRDLTQFDNYGQRGTVEFRHQPTKRMHFFLHNSFMDSPTTEAVQVAGVPFYRTGTTHDEFEGGASVMATKTLEIRSAYRFQWLEFDRPQDLFGALLQGGHAHGMVVDARQQVSPHWRVGASWDFRHSRLSGSTGTFDVQNTEGILEWQASPTMVVEGGAGLSYLSLPAPLGTQTGPAFHAALRKTTQYAFLSLSARRSFVPAFSFGGSLQNQEVSGAVRVPFASHRGYVSTAVTWRDSAPALAEELGLKALWVDTTVGYALQRWLSIEGFYIGAFQDTPVAGGRVDRNRFGVQFVTSHPVRFE